QIEQTAKDILGDTGLEVTVSGFPVLRLDIVDVLIHDQIVLNTAGVIIGIIMSLIVFRSVIASVMTAVRAIIAGGSVLGMIGLLGTQITVMSNVVPALIMVLGYADAMHLTFAWRRYRAEGADPKEAARLAEEEVGAACILTAITTALAFLSLTLSDVEIVSRFAWIGAIGAVLGGMLVLAGNEAGLKAFEASVPVIDKRFPMRLGNHAAFHTDLQAPVAQEGRDRLEAGLFGSPALPLIDGRGAIWWPKASDAETLRAYTLGHQVTQPYDFTRAMTVGLREFAPDVVIVTGPGTTLGGAVAQTMIAAGWRGLCDKTDFQRRQEEAPLLIAMGMEAQRPLATGASTA
ncbi:MAG: MMPL family transporter, partial [Hyphomicrobiaceae bacterium]|nr:MMPL family transporter [Hyphomicrobiaceae bacterium]